MITDISAVRWKRFIITFIDGLKNVGKLTGYTCELASILFYLSIGKTFLSLYRQRWSSKWGLRVVTLIWYQPGCRRRLSLCWLTSPVFCSESLSSGSSPAALMVRPALKILSLALQFSRILELFLSLRKDLKPFFQRLVWEIHIALGHLYSRLVFDVISQLCWSSQQPLTPSVGPRVPPGW